MAPLNTRLDLGATVLARICVCENSSVTETSPCFSTYSSAHRGMSSPERDAGRNRSFRRSAPQSREDHPWHPDHVSGLRYTIPPGGIWQIRYTLVTLCNLFSGCASPNEEKDTCEQLPLHTCSSGGIVVDTRVHRIYSLQRSTHA